MKILVQHIENLLPEHDCIVVPGLGGFVQNEVRAGIEAETGILRPATKEICFNPRLKFNDGLLAQSYQEIFGLTFEEANQQIQVAVQEIHQKLQEGKFIRIGRIGTISITDGQTVFRPDHKNHFLPESYGLTPFAFVPLTAQTQTEPLNKKQQKLLDRSQRPEQVDLNHRPEVKYRPSDSTDNRNVELENAILLAKALKVHGFGVPSINYNRFSPRRSRTVQFMVGIAICLFFLFVSKPVSNLSSNNQEANLMMHQYMGTPPTGESMADFANMDSSIAPSSSKAKSESIGSVLDATAKVIVRGRFRSDVEVQHPESTFLSIIQETLSIRRNTKPGMPTDAETVYYVVVSTFSQRETAETWLAMRSNDPALLGASIININGWYRVATRSFKNKFEARQFLKNYTESYPEYSSAWIFNQGK